MTIRFPFNELKAAQAAAHLLHRHGGRHNYMALIKLLYLADRQALLEAGVPITGDRMVSMPHGTVLSGILDLVNMGRENHNPWFDYVSPPQNYEVNSLLRDAPSDELSDFEIGILDEVDEQYGHLNQWQLRDLTHELPEWVDPDGSSFSIDPATILSEEGKTQDEIRNVANHARESSFLSSLER